MVSRNPSTKTLRLLTKWLPRILGGALVFALQKIVGHAITAGVFPWLDL